MKRNELIGKLAVVTGASHGIGKAMAIGLARSGCDVILVARRFDELEKVATRIKAEGRNAFVYALDLGNTSDLASVVDAITKRFEVIDILWNGAFGFIEGQLEEIETAQLIEFLDASVRGTIVLTHGLLPSLLRADHPAIINVSADWEFPANNGLSAFIAAKRAIAGFGIALGKEKNGKLRVTNIYPADVASVGFDIDDESDEIIKQHGDLKIQLCDLVDLAIFILQLKSAVVHQINVKPVKQDIGMTFLS